MAKRKQPKSAPAAKTIKKDKISARDTEPNRAAEVPQAPISPTTKETDETEGASFPVVGIGASAGGLEAFTEILQNLPANTGMGFVLVPHLDPKHVSLLTELLRRHTSMPVQDATNGVEVQPNQIYIIPRDTHMTLVRGRLMLSPRQGTPTAHMPIDPFLRSLAADRKGRAIGVILSGNASDGTLGMMAIKAAGGITFAQSSESAKYDSMPRSAAAAGCIDFVLPPKEIAKELARLPQHPYIAPIQSGAEGGEVAAGTTEAIGRILILLRNATGVDFTYYKPSTLRRRILRRMALRRIDNLDQYFTQLRSNSAELNALYEDILINVTEFFRDPEVFETLKTVVFPKIVPARNNNALRIWVPGCASGEEVYSIAIALLEFLGERSNEVPMQIFGTDISDVALEKARSATYAPGLVEGISSERLRRFFTKTDSTYVVAKRIREMCVFAKQNLIKDPPFSKIDLISCRNVMIYLGHVLQKRLIPIFHYALRPNGFLLLGTSETTGNSELFSPVDKKSKIYQRIPGNDNIPLEPVPEEAERQPAVAQHFSPDWSEAESSREADRIVLGNYAPCGVVVDNRFNVVQFRGRTSAYLENPSGAANLNILAMAREGLLTELRSALYRSRRENTAVRREGLRVQRDTGVAVVNFEVIPFKRAPGRESRYLVLFDEARVLTLRAEKKSKKRLNPKALERDNDQLRQELGASKEYLQSVVEQHETANEELRSANEEIQSSNEEAQSTNEELETAKEELQSTNEELNTVNEELQVRNLQLAQTGNDLNNLLSNVNIPIIMVGNDLRIRRFTPVSQRILNLIPTDVGRPISDININLDVPRLDRLLLEVMESLAPQTLQVTDSSGRPYSLRIRPYRTEDNRIDGAVIVLVDLDPERLLANSIQAVEGLPQPADGTQEMNDTLRAFSAGLMVAQERERRNLAVELHDDITQRLALLELGLESLQRTPPKPDELSVQLKMLEDQVTDLSDRMRHVAQQLHPSMVDDLGLVPALESLVREFNNQQEIEVTFQHDNVPGRLDPNAGLCLYRVVQEALHNVVKHSGAKSAQIRLKGIDGNAVKLSILDTGIGFEPNGARGKGRLGLRSMEERVRFLGGTFQIQSQPGKGTEVTVTVPQSTSQKNQAQRA